MRRAREAILSRGGAVHFQRLHASFAFAVRHPRLAQRSRNAGRDRVAAELVSFHLTKVSYWARTVLVPLLVLQVRCAPARKIRSASASTSFLSSRQQRSDRHRSAASTVELFPVVRGIDIILRPAVKFFPKSLRQRAINKAVDFVTERLNGQDGLGAIFPAMANATLMYDVLGDKATPRLRATRLIDCWSFTITRPIASHVCRQSGTRR